jgi:hypothetical protein
MGLMDLGGKYICTSLLKEVQHNSALLGLSQD